jgi:hypothetical protein
MRIYTGPYTAHHLQMPKAGIRFGSNQKYKNMLADPVTGKVSPGKTFLAGLGAGVCVESSRKKKKKERKKLSCS